MLERSQLALKILCGVLGALVLYRLVLVVVHINPLYHVTIPPLPSLAAVTENPTKGTNSAGPAKPATNAVVQTSVGQGTNHSAQSTNWVNGSTNRVNGVTNVVALGTNTPARSANQVAGATNTLTQLTNTVARATNSAPGAREGNAGPTAGPPPQLAAMGMGMPPGRPRGMPPGGFPGLPPGMFPGGAAPGPPLPPGIQPRIDRVIDSEILAPIMRPLPMALLGIAGDSVFFRAPNGQTGLIKPGEELGGVKLVRVGINRVLVEEQGEQKELTIFAGLGGDSLLSTHPTNSPK